MLLNINTAYLAALKKLIAIASMLAILGISGNAHAVRVLVMGGTAGTGPFVTEQIFANGDLTGTVDRPDWNGLNTLTAENVAANYDVIVVPYNASGGNWDTFVLPFLASGGGVVWEAYATNGTLPLISGPGGTRYVCPDGTICYIPNTSINGYTPLDISSVPGLTDGLTSDFTYTLGYFSNWDARLSPFITVDAVGLGTIAYGLQGEIDAGRMVISQFYTDRNGDINGTAQEANAYNLLKNAIAWSGASTNPPNPDLRFYPDVVGMTVADAQAAIAARDFVINETTFSYSRPSIWEKPDTVWYTNPTAGQGGFAGEALISFYTISIPNGAPVAVPDLTGLTFDEQFVVLGAANLELDAKRISSYHPTVPANQIIRQFPLAGEMTTEGWSVGTVLSLGPSTDRVPNVTYLTQAQAEAELVAMGYLLGNVTFVNHPTIPAGLAIDQNPYFGIVPAGTSVDVVISAGPAGTALVAVPDVTGQAQADAEAALTAVGFTVSTSTANSETVPAGTVISQTPAGGTEVTEGSVVSLVISSGPAPAAIVVPNVTGLAQADAEASIAAASLTLGTITTANSDTVAAGNVISQTPAAGTEAASGDVVDLVVSTGPAPVVILVPNVTGQAQADAEASITGTGLTVGTVTTASSSTVAAGNVISQTPAGGTEAAAGDAVDLVVSTGPALVTVPSVTGQSQANAEAAIVAANLTVGNITTASSNTVAAGNVISQSPAGGTDVTEGTAVDLLVSTGPDLIVVPNVVGLSYSTAVATIENAGLTVGNVSTVTTRRSCGRVNSQNPTGGTSVAAGTAVDLVVTRTRTCNPL